jgi:putative SOS response-associated peptidase YedK
LEPIPPRGKLSLWKTVRQVSSEFGFNQCINVRAETMATKPAFKQAFAKGRRCIVPMNGFFEWKKTRRRQAADVHHAQIR